MDGTLVLAAVGFFAGLNSACWGAYKDSPYEGFSALRFLRSVVLGVLTAVFALTFLKYFGISALNLGVAYGVIVVLERALTEFIKAYVRNEPQDKYKIPSRVHLLGRVVEGRGKRIMVGIPFTVGFILFTIAVFSIPTPAMPNGLLGGAAFGLIGGVLIAAGGCLKDAPIEGFDWVKFLRSPSIALTAGLFLSYFTSSYGLIMLSAMGVERMATEFYKTFLKSKTPGKFKAENPTYESWVERRRMFTLPYLASWIVFAMLFSLNAPL